MEKKRVDSESQYDGPEELQEFIMGLRDKFGPDPLGTQAYAAEKAKKAEEEKKAAEEERLPEQGNYVGKFVDVEDEKGNRLGTGKCLREDFGPPWQNEVKMLIPPSWEGKVLKNKRLKLSPTQQIHDPYEKTDA